MDREMIVYISGLGEEKNLHQRWAFWEDRSMCKT